MEQLMENCGGSDKNQDKDVNNENKRMAQESPTTFSSYMSTKKAKLNRQFDADVERLENTADESGLEQENSQLFQGIRIHTNGCSNPSNEELRELIGRYGGKHDFYFSRTTTTHVVAETLAFTKVKFFNDCKVVKPAWILDSIAAGKLLPLHNYSVLMREHKPYEKGEKNESDDKMDEEGEEEDHGLDEVSDVLDFDSDEDNTSSAPSDGQSLALKAGDPGFLEAFFSKSRLHHLSTAGNDFKSFIQDKRNAHPAEFIGLQRLKRFVSEMNLSNDSKAWDESMIMHIDMDCFFVSVGLLNKPHLRNSPVVVAHAKTGRGEQRPDQPLDQPNSFSELASCNYEARKFGIRNGMFVRQALKLCPSVQIIPYNFEEYDRVSKILYELLSSFTLDIEAVSCDEMFVDIKKVIDEAKCEPKVFASFIRQEMRRLTQCDASVGIGPNVLIAKLASKAAKPNDYRIVAPEDVAKFMSDQKLDQLPGIGRSIASKLAEKFSAESCAEMSHVPVDRMREVFGKGIGEKIYSMCRGIDRSELKFDQASARKSVSVEVNYGIRFSEWEALQNFMWELSEETSKRMLKIRARGKCITLKVKVRRQDAPVQTAKYMGHGICDNLSRSTLLSFPTRDAQLIGRSVVNILKSMNIPVPDLRGIAIQITKLSIDRPVTEAENVPENPNSIQRFFHPTSSTNRPSTSSSLPVPVTPRPAMQSVPIITLDDIDLDVLKELPEDIRLEITNSLRSRSGVIENGSSSGKGKTSTSKKNRKSPKSKKQVPVVVNKAGPLDRMFSNMSSESMDRKVVSVMNTRAALCGQVDLESMKDILIEWINTEERLHDEDVAYVTKFVLDLVYASKWQTLAECLKTMQRQFELRNESNWSEAYNTILNLVINDSDSTDMERHLLQDLHLL